MGDNPDEALEALGELILAQHRLALDREPAAPPHERKPPEHIKPGVRRETHIKRHFRMWGAR